MSKVADNITRTRVLADIAKRINAQHKASALTLSRGLDYAIAVGELLVEARLLCRYGEWRPWVWENCPMSLSNAQLFAKIARRQRAQPTKPIEEMTREELIEHIRQHRKQPRP